VKVSRILLRAKSMTTRVVYLQVSNIFGRLSHHHGGWKEVIMTLKYASITSIISTFVPLRCASNGKHRLENLMLQGHDCNAVESPRQGLDFSHDFCSVYVQPVARLLDSKKSSFRAISSSVSSTSCSVSVCGASHGVKEPGCASHE